MISTRAAREIRAGITVARQVKRHERVGRPDDGRGSSLFDRAFRHTTWTRQKPGTPPKNPHGIGGIGPFPNTMNINPARQPAEQIASQFASAIKASGNRIG